MPTRHGRDRAEQLRRKHLLSAHLTQLTSGAVVLTEVPPLFAETARMADRRGLPAGALPSTVRGASEPKTATTGTAIRSSRPAKAVLPPAAAARKRPRTPTLTRPG